MINHLQIANLLRVYMLFSVPASILNFGTRQRAYLGLIQALNQKVNLQQALL
jgi:hypothetical protein